MNGDKNYKMGIVKMFYDTETCGLDPRKSSIIQLAGCIEVDGTVMEKFDYNIRPHPKATIEPEALAINKKTEAEIQGYQEMKTVHKKFMAMLSKYTDRYSKDNKVYLVGFNNRKFDDLFLQKFFELCGDRYFFGIFYTETIDVICLAAQYLIPRRKFMPSFKLKRVALELGFNVYEEDLHDATFDADLTRQIYRVITGLESEPSSNYRYFRNTGLGTVYKTYVDQIGSLDTSISFLEYKELLKANDLHDGPQMIQDDLF